MSTGKHVCRLQPQELYYRSTTHDPRGHMTYKQLIITGRVPVCIRSLTQGLFQQLPRSLIYHIQPKHGKMFVLLFYHLRIRIVSTFVNISVFFPYTVR